MSRRFWRFSRGLSLVVLLPLSACDEQRFVDTNADVPILISGEELPNDDVSLVYPAEGQVLEYAGITQSIESDLEFREVPVSGLVSMLNAHGTLLTCADDGVKSLLGDKHEAIVGDACTGLYEVGRNFAFAVSAQISDFTGYPDARLIRTSGASGISVIGLLEARDPAFLRTKTGRALLRVSQTAGQTRLLQVPARNALSFHPLKQTSDAGGAPDETLQGFVVDLGDAAGNFGLAEVEDAPGVLYARGHLSGDIFRISLEDHAESAPPFRVSLARRQLRVPARGFVLDLLDDASIEGGVRERLIVLEDATAEDLANHSVSANPASSGEGYSVLSFPFEPVLAQPILVPFRADALIQVEDLEVVGHRWVVLVEALPETRLRTRLAVVDIRALDDSDGAAIVVHEFDEPYDDVRRLSSHALVLGRTLASGAREASVFDLRTGVRRLLAPETDEAWHVDAARIRQGEIEVLFKVEGSMPYRLVRFGSRGQRIRSFDLPAVTRRVFDVPTETEKRMLIAEHPGAGGFLTRFEYSPTEPDPEGHSVRFYLPEVPE